MLNSVVHIVGTLTNRRHKMNARSAILRHHRRVPIESRARPRTSKSIDDFFVMRLSYSSLEFMTFSKKTIEFQRKNRV